MTNYYLLQDEQIVLFDTDKTKLQNTLLFAPQYAGLEIQETERDIDTAPISNVFMFTDTDEYKAEVAQAEAERLAMLYLTAADVERAIYQVKGMDFDDIITYLTANPVSGLDIKALKIEFKANNFYRGNTYINTIGTILGFSASQLNKFFETNDYRYLTNVTLTVNATPTESIVTINGTEQTSASIAYGESATYSVSCDGYISQSGTTAELTEDTSIAIELVPAVTLTIEATPAESIITIDGIEQSSITVATGTTVEYSVSCEGYVTQTGSVDELTEDKTITIELIQEPTTDTEETVTDDTTVEETTTDENNTDTAD